MLHLIPLAAYTGRDPTLKADMAYGLWLPHHPHLSLK